VKFKLQAVPQVPTLSKKVERLETAVGFGNDGVNTFKQTPF